MKGISLFWKGVKEGLHQFAATLTVMVNSSLLLLVYLLGVGITALCARIFRKRFLETELHPKQASYWSDLNLKKKELKEYYRQF